MADPKMVTMTNVGECDRVFPSGDIVAKGASGDVPADDLSHVVVKAWLSEGVIKKGKADAEAPAAAAGNDADAVKKAAEDAQKAAEAEGKK
jgi:hypothetical protein